MAYIISDWYWIVNSSTTQVFSSARASYVPISDSAYQTWLAAGNLATPIPTDGELTHVLLQSSLSWNIIYPVGQTDVSRLDGSDAALAKQVSGIIITSTSQPSLNGTYSLDPTTVSNLDGLYVGVKLGDGFPGGGTTFEYPDISGSLHTFDESHFSAFGIAVRNYLYSLNQAGITNGPWPSANVTII